MYLCGSESDSYYETYLILSCNLKATETIKQIFSICVKFEILWSWNFASLCIWWTDSFSKRIMWNLCNDNRSLSPEFIVNWEWFIQQSKQTAKMVTMKQRRHSISFALIFSIKYIQYFWLHFESQTGTAQ